MTPMPTDSSLSDAASASVDPMQRPVRKVLTTRRGGVSEAPYDSFNLGLHVGDNPEHVLANRQRLASIIGLPLSSLVFMEQIHSANVTTVTAADAAQSAESGEPIEFTDALVTTERDLALVVLTADCVPVLLSDDTAGVIAAVHAGRLGARAGIIARTVERMVELGATPSGIHALCGAAAAGEDYEVPESMAADVERHLPGSRTRTTKGTPGLDIRAGIVRQLLSLGVRAIDADPVSTIADPEYFSYRREGTTGRQAGVIWMPASATTTSEEVEQ